MYGCESWTIKKAECQRIDAFELWCWRRFLRVPWAARRPNQPILNEISTEYSLGGLMLKLKLQHWPPDVKSWLIWEDPDAGKDWRWAEKGTTEDEMVGWHHILNAHEFGWTLGVGDGQGGLVCCSPWGRKESDITEQLNWTEGLDIIPLLKPLNLLKCLISFIIELAHWRRQWHPTPALLPGKSHGQRSLVGCSPWGH